MLVMMLVFHLVCAFLGVAGHVLLVEAQGVGVQVIPVHQILTGLVQLVDGVGQAKHEGHIGGRTDGDPLCLDQCSGVVVQRVNGDELRVRVVLLDLQQVVGRVACGGPGRVAAVQDHDVGLAQLDTVVDALVGLRPEADLARGRGVRAAGVGAPAGTIAAHLGENHLALAAVGDQDVLVAVLLDDAVDLIGADLNGLVPAQALPLILSAELHMFFTIAGVPVLALHGILETVGAQHVLALGAAADAGALLRIVGTVFVGVVGLLADDNAVHHQGLVQAAAAAVVPAGASDPLALGLDVHDLGMLCHRDTLSECILTRQHSQSGDSGGGRDGAFQEGPAAEFRI